MKIQANPPHPSKAFLPFNKIKLSAALFGGFVLCDYLFCDQRYYFSLKNRCFKLLNKKIKLHHLSNEEFEELLKKAGGYQKLAGSLECRLEDFSDSPEEAMEDLIKTLREIIYSNEWRDDYLTSFIKPLAQSEWFLNLVAVVGDITIGSKEKQKGKVSELFQSIFPWILGVSKGGISCLISNRYLNITMKLLDIALKKNEKPSSLSKALNKLSDSNFMQSLKGFFSEKRSAYIDILEIVLFILSVLILKKLFSLSAESYLRNYPPTKPFSLPKYQRYGHLYPREGNEDIKRFIDEDEHHTLFISGKDYELLLESLVALDRVGRGDKSLKIKDPPSDFFFMDLRKMNIGDFDPGERKNKWENQVAYLASKMEGSIRPIVIICRKEYEELLSKVRHSFNDYFIHFLLNMIKICKNPLKRCKVIVLSNELPEGYSYDQLFRLSEHPSLWGNIKVIKVQKPVLKKRLQQVFKKVDYSLQVPPNKEEEFWERLTIYAEQNNMGEMPSYLINKHFKSRLEEFQKKADPIEGDIFKGGFLLDYLENKVGKNSLLYDFQKLKVIEQEIKTFEDQCYNDTKQIMPIILKSHLPDLMKYEKYHYLATSVILRKKLLLPKMRRDYWLLKNKVEENAKKLNPHFTFDWLHYLETSDRE